MDQKGVYSYIHRYPLYDNEEYVIKSKLIRLSQWVSLGVCTSSYFGKDYYSGKDILTYSSFGNLFENQVHRNIGTSYGLQDIL
jgi:hypothetical protein